ncbi:MAG: hypothetical protein AAGH89_01090 [Verrucomicrobiota bacterium]
MKTKVFAILAVSVVSTYANSILVNFTAGLTPGSFSGPDQYNPYVPGNALNTFIQLANATTPGSGDDVLRLDGQFYIKDWDGSDGVFTTNISAGTQFLLHSPLLERLEADTWRLEDISDFGVTDGLGNPTAQRNKFLLPTSTTFGSASLTILGGVPTELSYSLDFNAPGVPDFTGSSLAGIPFDNISLTGNSFSSGGTFTIGVDDQNVPYGLNTALLPGSYPSSVLDGTVTDTTRGMLDNEINNNTDEIGGTTPNISTSGRLNGGPDGGPDSNGATAFYIVDPFLGESGTLSVFNANGDIITNFSVIPEPSSALFLISTLLFGVTRRRRA